MFYAKSMYLGGMIIGADEVDYNDYKRLGLRCLKCGEEIFLKQGDNKTQHFAHFKLAEKTKDDQEVCILRASSYNLCSWQELTVKGKNQRKILFQQFFLDIISDHYKNFRAYSQKNNNEGKTEKILIDDCIAQFNHFKKEVMLELHTLSLSELSDGIFADEYEFLLRKFITFEVIDYLTLPYTKSILFQIVDYCLYKDAKMIEEAYKQENQEKEKILPQILTTMLFVVDWTKHLEFYSSQTRKNTLISQKVAEKKIAKYPLFLNEKKLNIYIKTGISKYSRNHRGSFLNSGFNNYKFSLESDLVIVIHEDFFRNRKSGPIRKKSQKIAEISDILESTLPNVSKNKKVLNIYWKIDKSYQEKYSAKTLIFCQNKIEEFLSKLFLSKFELNFSMQK
jgi:hypothetical protein